MGVFEEGCAELGVEVFLLPPRSPKLNGRVERLHRTFREEFYTQPLPVGLEGLRQALGAYLVHYNTQRPHQALGGLTPKAYLDTLDQGAGPPGVSDVVAGYRCLTIPLGFGILFFALPQRGGGGS